MRRLTLTILFGLILASWAFDATAGSYPITTSDKEDALLQAELDQENARRAAQEAAALTMGEYVQRRFNQDTLRPLKDRAARQEARDACAAYKALAPADQQTIVTLLGGKAPC